MAVSLVVVILCDLATGGLFMGARLLTVMETFPALLVDVPSLAVNGNYQIQYTPYLQCR